jgi:hypothetical protein
MSRRPKFGNEPDNRKTKPKLESSAKTIENEEVTIDRELDTEHSSIAEFMGFDKEEKEAVHNVTLRIEDSLYKEIMRLKGGHTMNAYFKKLAKFHLESAGAK